MHVRVTDLIIQAGVFSISKAEAMGGTNGRGWSPKGAIRAMPWDFPAPTLAQITRGGLKQKQWVGRTVKGDYAKGAIRASP